jgi:hypothetical protein
MPAPVKQEDAILVEMMQHDFEQLPKGEQFIIQSLARELNIHIGGTRGLGETQAKVVLWAIGRLLNGERNR